tara:strand:- start:3016 stop:4551 length:1536 start_codon:yes stop_codon:yes gene_type:complete
MPFENVDIQSFAPDLRPDTPSVLVDGDGMYPTTRGYKSMPALVEAMPAPAGGWAYGSVTANYLDGSSRVFVGTNTKLEEANVVALTWADVSRATGGAYDVATNGRWRFGQFGNDTIAVNGNDVPQFINQSGSAFVLLPGSPPVAKYIATAQNFVMLANLSGTGVDENYWWCSAQGNDTDWTPDASSQSANGFLKDTPGPITGMHSIGRNIVIYKARSMYLMQYSGPPVIWRNNILSQVAGSVSNEAVVDIGGTHVFMGFSDFYIYDGSGPPKTLPGNIREFLFEGGDLDKSHSYAVVGRWDRETDVVFWHYPSVNVDQTSDDNVVLDKWVAWNIGTDRWAVGTEEVSTAVLPELGDQLGLTYDSFGSSFANYNTPNNVTWTGMAFTGGPKVIQGVFSPVDNKLYSYTGDPDANQSMVLGKWGDHVTYRKVNKVRPIFAKFPKANTEAKCSLYSTEILGSDEVLVSEQNINMQTGWFDVQGDGRYVHPKFEFSGDVEVIGYVYDFIPNTGSR